MPRTSATKKIKASSDEMLLNLTIDAIQDIKGKNIMLLDLRHLQDAPAKYFIICEGESSIQIRAIAANVLRRAKEELKLKAKSEGQLSARWVLVDFFDIVVHIFDRETRHFYDLEDLWSDAKLTEYKNI